MSIDPRENLSKVRELFRPVFFAGPFQVLDEGFHAVETGFVERFEDVERSKEERPRAASGIQDSHALDCVPECAQQLRPLGLFDDILRELPDIEVQSDQIVDIADFSGDELLPKLFTTLPACYDLAPDFGR